MTPNEFAARCKKEKVTIATVEKGLMMVIEPECGQVKAAARTMDHLAEMVPGVRAMSGSFDPGEVIVMLHLSERGDWNWAYDAEEAFNYRGEVNAEGETFDEWLKAAGLSPSPTPEKGGATYHERSLWITAWGLGEDPVGWVERNEVKS